VRFEKTSLSSNFKEILSGGSLGGDARGWEGVSKDEIQRILKWRRG